MPASFLLPLPVAAWRREALVRFPELEREIRDGAEVESIYDLWRVVLEPNALQAHRKRDADMVRRVFDYALWNYRHPSPEIQGAVAVAFYEHLFSNRWQFGKDTLQLLPDDVITDVWPLWQMMLPRWKRIRLRRFFHKTGRAVPA